MIYLHHIFIIQLRHVNCAILFRCRQCKPYIPYDYRKGGDGQCSGHIDIVANVDLNVYCSLVSENLGTFSDHNECVTIVIIKLETY